MGCYGNCRRDDRPGDWRGPRDPYGPYGPDYRRRPHFEHDYKAPLHRRRRPDYFDYPRYY